MGPDCELPFLELMNFVFITIDTITARIGTVIIQTMFELVLGFFVVTAVGCVLGQESTLRYTKLT